MTRKATRRRVLMGIGTGTAIGVAGCTGGSGSDSSSGGSNDSSDNTSDGSGSTSGGQETSSSGASAQQLSGPLQAGGSSTVYPIASNAASVWNSNAPADDGEYWGSNEEGTAPGYKALGSPDMAMADFFASIYGFDTSSEGAPYQINVGLSHSGTGLEKLMNEQVDIGNSSASVKAELPDRSSYKNFKDHVVGVDGQPVVVSRPIYEAGVKKLTGEQLKAIYRGEITKWQNVEGYNGPDKEIQALCRSKGSGTDTAFRNNLFGDPDASIKCDARIGQNQQVRTTVSNSDNAIAYMALAFVGGKAPAIALELDGTTYKLGKNLGAKGYPLSRDLHCYTWEGTSKMEAAFLNMLFTKYGQEMFVTANNYFKLPPERRQAQREKLPEPAKQIDYGGANSSSGNSSG